jgi:hypothetical protein
MQAGRQPSVCSDGFGGEADERCESDTRPLALLHSAIGRLQTEPRAWFCLAIGVDCRAEPMKCPACGTVVGMEASRCPRCQTVLR